jgi:2TM domain
VVLMTVSTEPDVLEVPKTEEERRALALKRIKAKSDFKIHLVVYLTVNALFVVIWAMTNAGEPYPQGFFWPIFPMVGWGVGVVINGFVVYRRNIFTEDRVRREMKKLS